MAALSRVKLPVQATTRVSVCNEGYSIVGAGAVRL